MGVTIWPVTEHFVELRVPVEIADVSNLDSRGEILAQEDCLRLFMFGSKEDWR